jgi:hypothetical protein
VLVVLLLDLFASHSPHFPAYGITFDTFPWFYPLLGFAATVALIIAARTLGILLARTDQYYAD